MPKATAIWLIENTTLSFEQIAEFCNMHILEIQGIADGDVASGIQGHNPIDNGQLTQEEINRCQNESKAKLNLIKNNLPEHKLKTSGTRYTPLALRQQKPRAIFWLTKKYGDELKYIITLVAGGNNGAVYKADNWEYIGKTAGLAKERESFSVKWSSAEHLAKTFIPPTGENKKLIFIKEL